MTTSIGNYLLDRLHELGVRHVFGVPGDYVLKFNKLVENHAIQFINTTIENSAGYMADAEARLLGLGVACITYGVGIGIANSVAQAFVESSPVVIISGAAGTDEYLKCHYLHHLINRFEGNSFDSTQLEIFKQITGAQAVLNDASTAAAEIDRVLSYCLQNKKPVYIELPRNFVHASIPKAQSPLHFPKKNIDRQALDEAMNEIANLLNHSSHPVIWVGHEITRYCLGKPLIEFAEKFDIPIVSSLVGKTAVNEQHPLFVGVYQGEMSRPEVREFVGKSDCLLILGTILSDVETGIFSAKLQAQRVLANNEKGIQVLHHHYSDIPFPDFIQQLPEITLKKRFNGHKNHKKPSIAFKATSEKITVQRFFECLQTHLTEHNIVVTDIGDSLFGSADLILDENSFFSSAYFETLGFGAPGAIAAQLAQPKRRVIGIAGDGGFQMTAMELSTAVRYKLDPIIIVLNNHGYGTERPLLEGSYNDIQDWNYANIPFVIGGGIGVEVTTEKEFEDALKKALDHRGEFTLIEVELEKDDFSPTMRRFSALVNKQKVHHQ